ncbi:MAG: hypothetical protein HDT14_08580 [Oscillibacter sp.]|nr:hypothetical protein [Oscillibacter sp.]
MDFNTLANGIYANMNTAVPLSQDGTMRTTGRDEFLKEAERAWSEATEKRAEDKLYAGSETRTTLAETEIAVLRNKYDVRNMSDEQYDDFLDDLEDMGAISGQEKRLLGYNGNVVAGDQDEKGGSVWRNFDIYSVWEWLGKDTPAFKREDANGDILRWITDRLKWNPVAMTAAQRENEAAEIDLFENLSAILARMTGTQPVKAQESGGREADAEPDLIDQIADPGSAFYQDMFQRMRLQLEESEEERKKQAVIDALDAVLEGMRSTDGAARRKDMVSSIAELSKEISRLDEDDPGRTQLDLFRQRPNRMGIYMDLDAGGGDGKRSLTVGETLTQMLIREEEQTPYFDMI